MSRKSRIRHREVEARSNRTWRDTVFVHNSLFGMNNVFEGCVFDCGCKLLSHNNFVDCIINSDCSIGNVSTVGGGTVVRNGCSFGPYSRFLSGVVFGRNNKFGPESRFESGCRLGDFCSVGSGCVFDSKTKVGDQCDIGDGCIFGYGSRIEGKPLLGNVIYRAGGFGFEDRTTYAIPMRSDLYIRCGCWFGTIKEFRKRVEQVYPGELIREEYLLMADMFQARWKRELVEMGVKK